MASITRRLAAVAFADVAGWTHLVEQGELEALHAWHALRADVIEPKIAEHGGRLVDMAGDSVLVEFLSAVEAVGWAIDLQRRDTAAQTSSLKLMLRIGINVSEVLVDEGRLAGDGVNIAARIHQAASPGEIVVTESVWQHVHRLLPVAFRDLGTHELKNVGRPIRIYRVEADAAAPPRPMEAGAQRAMSALMALAVPAAGAGKRAGSQMGGLSETVAREAPARGGRVIGQHEGALLVEFPDARPAVNAAFAIQQGYAATESGRTPEPPGIGIQSAEDAAGGAAAVAAGLTLLARPGGIAVSSAVRSDLTATLDADIEDLGECILREGDDAVRIYRVAPPQSLPVERSVNGNGLLPTVAVIPFAERGQGHEPLGDILAEEVIAALSRSSEVNVVSRLSTTAFRGRDASLDQVVLHLKANYVLSGTYRVSGGKLVLAGELADAKSGRVVWAGDLPGSVSGIVEGSDALIDRIVAEVSLAVMKRELERARAQSLHSLETCTLLVAAIALMHRLSRQDAMRAREMLLIVAQRVPRHPIPLAWLAKWHVLRVWQSWSDNVANDTRLALDCTRRALDIDSQCSLALAIDGFAHTNLRKALDVAHERYDLALRVNPNDSLARLLNGMLHAFKGEGAQAVEDTQRALRLSPLDPHRYFYESLAASAQLSAGNYEQAIELAKRSLRANRMHASTFRALAISQWQLGRHEEARATVAELMKVEPALTVGAWFERSPSSEYAIGRLCAQALRGAGVPQ